MDLLKGVPADSVDLIMTSPPYADQRKSTYGGIHPDEYVAWWEPIAVEMQRVLRRFRLETGHILAPPKSIIEEDDEHPVGIIGEIFGDDLRASEGVGEGSRSSLGVFPVLGDGGGDEVLPLVGLDDTDA